MSNFITYQSEGSKLKIKNLYLVNMFLGFVWILFHFTIIFFFGIVLESAALVGVFLGIGNFVALLVDIPVGVLQKYIKPKNFLYLSSSFFIIACFIFLRFLLFKKGVEAGIEIPTDGTVIDKTGILLKGFLSSGLNLGLLILVVALYGIIKEANDVTMLSYILNNSNPSETAGIISKKNIFAGIGSMIGLLISGGLLALNSIVAVLVFFIITVLFIIFLHIYFDNQDTTVNVSDITKIRNLKLDQISGDLSKKRDEVISSINTKNVIELAKKQQAVILKPIDGYKKIDFKEVFKTTKEGFQIFYKILTDNPNLVLLWILGIIMVFGFWDTFLATFQIDFLKKILSEDSSNSGLKIIGGYGLLGLMVIPAFVCQDMFIKLSKKIGVKKVVMLGTIISGVSLLGFGIFNNLGMIVIFGLLNSVGYAASMPIAQSTFSEVYTLEYSKKFNKAEVDSTVSAGPLKILLNAANVVGLLLGGLIVGILSFNVFFFLFSFILFGLLIFSIKKIKNVSLENKNDGELKVEKKSEEDGFQDFSEESKEKSGLVSEEKTQKEGTEDDDFDFE